MKVVVPDYYNDFSCRAGECGHTCCIGWEIDIDENTAEFYRTLRGAAGEKMKRCVRFIDGGAEFILGDDERCPFLNENNLCELILEFGESSLCQICRDHPRFRNFFSDRTELGLGLCCETAAGLILGRTGKPLLTILADDGGDEECTAEETEFFTERDALLEKVPEMNRGIEHSGLSPEFMLSLERLDGAWTEKLDMLASFREKTEETAVPDGLTVPFEQLLAYLIYRHLPDGDGSMQFVSESLGLIKDICRAEVCRKGTCTLEDLEEIAREWSAEIEYSDENEERIIRELCLSH